MRRRASRLGPALGSLVLLAACAHEATETIRIAEDHREPASEALIRLSREGSLDERFRAARAMGRIQSPAYADALAAASRSSETELRHEALFALGQLGLAVATHPGDAALGAVTAGMGDADPAIAATAVEALGKLAPEGAAERIAPLLRHENAGVRREAAHALFRLRFVPVWRKQSDTPPPLPGPALRALVAALEDGDTAVRRAAAHAFSRYGQPDAVSELQARLGDSDAVVRMFAARGLGRSAEPGAAPALAGALEDGDLHVRTEAILALTRLERVGALPRDFDSDGSFHVRTALAQALEHAEDDASLAALRRLRRDPSATVRRAALRALTGRLGEAAAEIVDEYLGDTEWAIRVAAAIAAGELGSAGRALVERALADPDIRVRVAALGSAAKLDPATEAIVSALDSEDLALRGTALALYIEHMRPPDPERLLAVYEASDGPEWIEIREALTDALAELDGARSLLERIAATDPAPSVRGNARLALGLSEEALGDGETPPVVTSPWIDQRFAEDPRVALETSKGTLIVRGLPGEAPNHVAAFVERVRAGFYDGLAWHRVVPNFVIQGGDPRGDGWGGADPPLRDEINRRRFERGVLGMPKAGKDTGSCQLFFTHVPTPHLDGNYTVFGIVESGLEVIDAIEVGDEIESARVLGDGSPS